MDNDVPTNETTPSVSDASNTVAENPEQDGASNSVTPTQGSSKLAQYSQIVQVLFSYTGAVISGILWWAHRNDADLSCSSGGGCEEVWTSRWAHFNVGPWHDIPLALVGLSGYLLLFTLAMAGSVLVGRRRRIIAVAGLVVAAGGFLYSWYLQYVAHFVIQAFCPWCFTSACIMTVVFIANVTAAFSSSPAESTTPMRAAIVGWVVLLVLLPILSSRLGTMAETRDNAAPVHELTSLTTTTVDLWSDIMSHTIGTVRGPSNAPWSLVEFGDFECGPCGKWRPAFEKALRKDPINMYFVQCPWPSIHKHALVAAEAAESAAAHGKFWQMYDELYSHQKDLDKSSYVRHGNAVGLDGRQVEADVLAGRYDEKIFDESQFDVGLGIRQTPTAIVRNNKTGQMEVYSGGKELVALFKRPVWNHPDEMH